jgi:site-specific DNA recombinase
MPNTQAAAVYARISSDQEGAGLGVARQLQDCRRLAADLGWPVAEEYVDNDVSAFSGKARPAYQRMLAELTDGARDSVVVYHVGRLTRRPIELEQFLEVVTAASVRHVRFVAGGDVDIGNGDGLMVVRMLQAVAANESATKSRRVRRKLDEVAASGRPHGGSNRPFGYEGDRMTVRPDEAGHRRLAMADGEGLESVSREVVRSLVARYLAGESLRSLATWLDDNGVRTVTGKAWSTPTLRDMLASGRIAGLRRHRGQIVGPAAWPAIITPEQRDKVVARLNEAARTGRRHPRTYLLTGLLRCGRCDNKLFSSARGERRRYVCASGPDHGGCGRLTVVAPPLEELIADAVLYRLDTPELADALAGRAAADERSAALAEELSADRAQLDELAASTPSGPSPPGSGSPPASQSRSGSTTPPSASWPRRATATPWPAWRATARHYEPDGPASTSPASTPSSLPSSTTPSSPPVSPALAASTLLGSPRSGASDTASGCPCPPSAAWPLALRGQARPAV